VQQLEQQEYLNFINSLHSHATIVTYTNALKDYMRHNQTTNISFLMKQDNKAIENQIISYLVNMRQRRLSYSVRNTRLSAVKKFYEMNDVMLNWRKISQYLGEKTKVVKDRAYTTEEIQQLLIKADERMRVVILLLASSGMRIGAIPDLKLRQLKKVENYSVYQIVVYENSNDEYYCFCSPECAAAIDSYLQYRQRCYEKITPDSPLIREQFNKHSTANTPRHITIENLGWMLTCLLRDSGVQSIEHLTENITNGRIRKDVMRAHGFRKFVETNMIRSKINPEAREMLLGHSIGLGNAYYRPHPDELLQEYLGCVDSLTINNEHRLQRKVETLTIRADKLSELEERMNSLQKRFGA
jgi:integrase